PLRGAAGQRTGAAHVMLPLAAPALPLHEAGKYVAAAYIVFVALLLIYVAIMAAKLTRIERELTELNQLAATRDEEPADDREEVAAG
ncbi:MAG: hypothetical protein JWN32_1836, partial [Solirubrobacterales bacterium]|nr:hypothetical protein [Solirubrobacterales bacterium]